MAEKKISWVLKAKDKMSAVLNRAGSRVKKFAGGAAKMMKKFALGFGLAGAGVVALTKKLIDNADAIGKVSKRLGVTAEFYQKLTFAAERSGASQGAVEKGIKKMQATIFDAGTGLKTYIRYFEELGINYKDLEGLSPEKQFKIIAAALNNVADATTKSALAQKIFGRAGIELIPMLKDYNSLAQEVVDRGAIISNENIQKAEEFKDAMTNIGTTIQASLLNSGFVKWLADIIDKMDAAYKLKKAIGTAKENGATGEYMKKQGWFDKTVDATAGMFGGGSSKFNKYVNPFSAAAHGIKAMGWAGTRETGKEALISTPAISKEEVISDKKTKDTKKQAAAEAKAKAEKIKEDARAKAEIDKKAKAEASAKAKAAKIEEGKKGAFDKVGKDLEYRIKLQGLLNKKLETEAELLKIENQLGRNLTENEKAKFAEKIKSLKALEDKENKKALEDKENKTEPDTSVKAPSIGDNATALEKIGAVIGGSTGSGDKTYKVQTQIAKLTKESVKIQKEILDRTNEAALQNV